VFTRGTAGERLWSLAMNVGSTTGVRGDLATAPRKAENEVELASVFVLGVV